MGLGVVADWKNGPHLLTYRQTERTFCLVTAALGKDQPDGLAQARRDQHLLDHTRPPGVTLADGGLTVAGRRQLDRLEEIRHETDMLEAAPEGQTEPLPGPSVRERMLHLVSNSWLRVTGL